MQWTILGALVLVEVDDDSACDLSTLQLFDTLGELAHAAHFADLAEKATPGILQTLSGILHCTNKRTLYGEILECVKAGVGAESDFAGGSFRAVSLEV